MDWMRKTNCVLFRFHEPSLAASGVHRFIILASKPFHPRLRLRPEKVLFKPRPAGARFHLMQRMDRSPLFVLFCTAQNEKNEEDKNT